VFAWLRGRRRRRVLARQRIPQQALDRVLDRYAFMRALEGAERARLGDLVTLFLHEKSLHGAGGLVLEEDMRFAIAAQACLPILNLGLDYYQGWSDVIVYPGEFVPELRETDEAGVVHEWREPRTGEAWLGGPVILSWADIAPEATGAGVNVAIHEFAHKLDMLNGEADGYPPLHVGMQRQAWADVMHAAYDDFCRRVDADEETAIDPYAAEGPGEFFAVLSEAFFEAPAIVMRDYPALYGQLAAFYRQDPLARPAAQRPPGLPADGGLG
jgi:Mlc titration factor MtfA (ptsG expression regulator)